MKIFGLYVNVLYDIDKVWYMRYFDVIFCVIVSVRVVLKSIVVGNWYFYNFIIWVEYLFLEFSEVYVLVWGGKCF